MTSACERLGLPRRGARGGATYSIEFGNAALVDSLPGVPGGSSFLGTFDREQAVEDERLDFFASGHPLVEGVLAHLEDAPSGRVAVLHVAIGDEKGLGLLALYKDGPVFEAVAVDADGRPRPDWANALRARPLRTRRVPAETARRPGWDAAVRGSRRPSTRRGGRWLSPRSSSAPERRGRRDGRRPGLRRGARYLPAIDTRSTSNLSVAFGGIGPRPALP